MSTRFILALLLIAWLPRPSYSQAFMAVITKIEGNKITYQKATIHRVTLENPVRRYSYSPPETAELASNAEITRAHYVTGEGPSTSEGHITGKRAPLVDGLKNPVFELSAKEMKNAPFPFLMTISENGADKGKIESINVWRTGSRG